MKYLIDTCTYVWLMTNDQKRLSAEARAALQSDNSTSYVSIISQIEMTAKHFKHKIPGIARPVIDYYKQLRIDSGIELLNLTQEDIEDTTKLPKIHSDPFDRLLIAQAINRGMTILTPDKKFKKYPVRIIF